MVRLLEVSFTLIESLTSLFPLALLVQHTSVSHKESDQSRRNRFTQLVEDVLMEDPALLDHYGLTHFFPTSRALTPLRNLNWLCLGIYHHYTTLKRPGHNSWRRHVLKCHHYHNFHRPALTMIDPTRVLMTGTVPTRQPNKFGLNRDMSLEHCVPSML